MKASPPCDSHHHHQRHHYRYHHYCHYDLYIYQLQNTPKMLCLVMLASTIIKLAQNRRVTVRMWTQIFTGYAFFFQTSGTLTLASTRGSGKRNSINDAKRLNFFTLADFYNNRNTQHVITSETQLLRQADMMQKNKQTKNLPHQYTGSDINRMAASTLQQSDGKARKIRSSCRCVRQPLV